MNLFWAFAESERTSSQINMLKMMQKDLMALFLSDFMVLFKFDNYSN